MRKIHEIKAPEGMTLFEDDLTYQANPEETAPNLTPPSGVKVICKMPAKKGRPTIGTPRGFTITRHWENFDQRLEEIKRGTPNSKRVDLINMALDYMESIPLAEFMGLLYAPKQNEKELSE